MKHTLTTLAVLALVACNDNQTPVPEHGAYQAGAVEPLPCVPNLDGRIDARELRPAIGITATFLVSPSGRERMVDLVGATNADGQRVWQYATDFADDGALAVAASSLEGKWYAANIPAGADAFVAPIDAGKRTEGVYVHREDGIYLHGIASRSPDGPDKTLLPYTVPVQIYRFPLEPGATWTSVGEVKNGTFRGLPYAGRDTYEVKVDGAGRLELPDFTLTQALRVRTKVTVAPSAGQTTTQRQTSFLFECLGEVARATSRLDEPEENFTNATELRRLGLSPSP